MSIATIAKAIDALGVNKRISQAFTQIDEVSDDLSGQISTLASDTDTAINQVSSSVSTQIGQLSTNLSGEISAVATSISTVEATLGQQISEASQLASSANSNAVTAIDNAADALQAAAAASSAASGANATANSALAIAGTAADNANDALTAANSAASDASTALSTANDAVSSIVQPAAGITVSGTSTRTLALSDDLEAVEGISGTGIAVRTATNIWQVRLVTGTEDKITVTNEDGVAGNITVTVSATYAGQTSINTLGTVTTATWNATPIGTAYGGTNITSWTTGDLPYASATNTLSKLAGVATGNVLISGGVGVAPSYGKVDLAAHITGNLPVSRLNSGTNASGTTFWCGDGTWKSISSSATLTNKQIGVGDGSNLLSGSSSLTYDGATNTVQLGTGAGISIIRTATAVSGTESASLTIITGSATDGVRDAGILRLAGGAGAGVSNAGHIEFLGGDSPGTGAGGTVTIGSGNSTSGAKGTVIFKHAGSTIATVVTAGLEVTALIPTGTSAPSDGIYKKSAGVMGMAANNTSAFMWGSNAFVSQTHNSRDLGELATAYRDIFSANAVTVTSDIRTKTDVEDSALGLDFIDLLWAISYRKIVGQIAVSEDGENTQTLIPGVRRHYGLSAQQVKQVLDTLNVEDFAGWVLEDVNNPDSSQALRYEQFISPLIKATQQLHAKVKTSDARIQQLDARIQQLEAMLSGQ
jgi:hypothetical protein